MKASGTQSLEEAIVSGGGLHAKELNSIFLTPSEVSRILGSNPRVTPLTETEVLSDPYWQKQLQSDEYKYEKADKRVAALLTDVNANRARSILFSRTKEWPSYVAASKGVYDMTLAMSPHLYLGSKGSNIITGYDPLWNDQVDRIQAAKDAVLYFIILEGIGWVSKTTRGMASTPLSPPPLPLIRYSESPLPPPPLKPAEVILGESPSVSDAKWNVELLSGVYHPATNRIFLDAGFGHVDGANRAGLSQPNIRTDVGISVVIKGKAVYWATDSGSFQTRYPNVAEDAAIASGLQQHYPGFTVEKLPNAWEVVVPQGTRAGESPVQK